MVVVTKASFKSKSSYNNLPNNFMIYKLKTLNQKPLNQIIMSQVMRTTRKWSFTLNDIFQDDSPSLKEFKSDLRANHIKSILFPI
jgi:hypothetical protein